MKRIQPVQRRRSGLHEQATSGIFLLVRQGAATAMGESIATSGIRVNTWSLQRIQIIVANFDEIQRKYRTMPVWHGPVRR
jgi:hypothetical protein